MHVVLVTREVIPLVEGGGIARYVADAARTLAAEDDIAVTVLTSSSFTERHAQLIAEGDERATPPGVRWAWAPEPDGDLTPLWSHHHAWSLACWRAVEALAADGEPIDVLEFEDYGGAAAATLDAKRTGHPALEDTAVVVRLHTTWEMTQALDDLPLDDISARTVMALEHHSLAFADRLLAPGERTLQAYRDHYDALAPAVVTAMPLAVQPVAGDARAGPAGEGPLRIFYMGRLERRKGVEALVRAVLEQPPEAVTLRLAGGDTPSAPGGGSMREHLEALAGGDPRITFMGAVAHRDLPAEIRAHHLVAVPSVFESYGYVVREALAENRPVLGTDAGGVADALETAGAGWRVPVDDPSALASAIAELAAEPDRVAALIGDGAPRRALEQELERGRFADAYREPVAPRRAAAPHETPAIAAVIAVQRGDHDLERTVSSIEATAEPVELIVAASGPELVPAALLTRLHAVAVEDGGDEHDLRRAGLARATTAGPRLLLRAGDTVSVAFVERARRALARDSALAYVTAHAPGRRPSCAPIGNFGARLLPELHVEGAIVLAQPDTADALAVPGNEPPLLRLADEGRFGAVLGKQLIRLARPPAPAVSDRAKVPSG